MKRKAYWPLLIAAVILFCLVGLTGSAQKDKATSGNRVVWEYKTIRANRALTEDTLNDMGMYGWELVTFDDGERGGGSYGGTYYFKRQK